MGFRVPRSRVWLRGYRRLRRVARSCCRVVRSGHRVDRFYDVVRCLACRRLWHHLPLVERVLTWRSESMFLVVDSTIHRFGMCMVTGSCSHRFWRGGGCSSRVHVGLGPGLRIERPSVLFDLVDVVARFLRSSRIRLCGRVFLRNVSRRWRRCISSAR